MTKSVEELEIKVAFLEDALTKLSDEFYRQQIDLESLKTQQTLMVDKINNITSDESEHPNILDERPPHY